jgi:thiol-disulfide isomerase/thioredoxin
MRLGHTGIVEQCDVLCGLKLLHLRILFDGETQHSLAVAGKIGLLIALLSLGLVWKPLEDGIQRRKQSKNQAAHDVAAPVFETTDLNGSTVRLADHRGEVVLVNIWATWCGPCRAEMPNLDQLYRARKRQGFLVLGLSAEDRSTQLDYRKQVPVSYPLLTVSNGVPSFYREIARYPAFFLIDRNGQLQPAPGPDQPFSVLTSAVDSLLARPRNAR